MAEAPFPLSHLHHDELAPTTDARSALPDATRVRGVEPPDAGCVAAGSEKP
jgi:hypothetical protein